MDDSKRDFLKKAGVSVVGFGLLGTATSAVGRAIKAQAKPEQLTAKRWAMVIDAKLCAENDGCTACTDACHLDHNVPSLKKSDGTVDTKSEIKWLWKEHHEHAFPTQVHEYTPKSLRERPTLVTCNHCTNAPCVRVCPTQATWKRDDGLVMMDMHRCIGCRYCVVACPYGARSFNYKDPRPHIGKRNEQFPTRMKGVVEKCNFCAEKLARGEMPSCAEACEAGAITFGDVQDPNSDVAKKIRDNNTMRRKIFLGTKPHVFYIV